MVIEVLLAVCLLAVGAVCGVVFPAYRELRLSRQELKEKVTEFDEIMKKIADANNSHAQKILQMDEKVNNLEFWRQSSLTSTSAFKVK